MFDAVKREFMLFSIGLRPFFFLGAIWAATAMMIWIAMLGGLISLSINIDPVSWHAHEFLFGYLGAIIAGFLLTAIPSWTGRPPVAGLKLVLLVLIWVSGRIVFSLSDFLTPGIVAAIDLLFPIMLAVIVIYEIMAGQSWRNLIVVVALVAFVIANAIFHFETSHGDYGAQGFGMRFGVAAVLMQISVIGGRVIPAFTLNWMKKTGRENYPVKPMGRFDIITLVIMLACMMCWVVWPDQALSGYALLIAGIFQSIRLARWSGLSTVSNSLLFILHIGYAFIPLGAVFVGSSILFPDLLSQAASQHLWMAGAIGTMTLALMTRAALGHSGRELHAGLGTIILYLCIIGATVMRFLADLLPIDPMVIYSLSASLWIVSFLGFAILYFPVLIGLAAKQAKQQQ